MCSRTEAFSGQRTYSSPMTFKRGDKVKTAHDVALGQDVVIRRGCAGRIAQRVGTLNAELSHKYVVLFTFRDDIAENEIIVKGLVDADLEHAD